MNSKFRISDRVELNSGGPEMTIANMRRAGDHLEYLCTWTDAGHWHDWFSEPTLKHHVPPPMCGTCGKPATMGARDITRLSAVWEEHEPKGEPVSDVHPVYPNLSDRSPDRRRRAWIPL
jgi:uncharacterized protein YodC (DUF2158 family)